MQSHTLLPSPSRDTGHLREVFHQAIATTERYWEAWRSISQSGKNTLTTISNALVTLSNINDTSKTVYKPGDLGDLELQARSGLVDIRILLTKAEKLVDGVGFETKRIDEVIGEEMVDEVVWTTVTAGKWRVWLGEIVEMLAEDLKVKSWCVEKVGALCSDRELLYFCCAAWFEMASIDRRKVDVLRIAYEAEKQIYDGKASSREVSNGLSQYSSIQSAKNAKTKSSAISMLLS